MDSDRKSNVSSFYKGRKSSLDALNADFPPHQPGGARVRDDASSFFNPERTSIDALNAPRTSSAGYNRNSFFHAGREEPLKGGVDEEAVIGKDDAWDVYADFNNAGPRYSEAYTSHAHPGYQQIRTPSSPLLDPIQAPGEKVELVTVPAMGAEWSKEEMRMMTKAGRKEGKSESRRGFWKAWYRDQRGLCGKWFTRRFLVFFLFGLCAAIGIVLAFTIPRVPAFSFNVQSPLVNATGAWAKAIPTVFSRAPANFTFAAYASLQADTTANFLPLNFKHLRAQIYDLDTNKLVGTGDWGQHTLPAKQFPKFMVPLNFTYVATNSSDQTWLNWYNSCKNKALYADGNRQALKFRIVLDMGILGLPSDHAASTQISDASCPVELPINAA